MLDPIDLSVVMTSIGLIILIAGFLVGLRFRNSLETGSLARAWDKLLGLISLFIFGYIAYIAQIISEEELVNIEIVTSAVFLGGSIFVLAVAYLNYKAYAVE